MQKVILYGIGQRFDSFFKNGITLKKYFDDNDIKVVSVMDTFRGGQTTETPWGDMKVDSPDADIEYDVILVLSREYYSSICEELKKHNKENAVLIDDFIKDYVYELEHISFTEGKAGIEIGGPSDAFGLVYDSCKSCDDVNFSADTVWWKDNENHGFEVEGKTLGNVYINDATELSNVESEKYDFVLSSNNLEHIANPLKALKEFKRVLKDGGYLYLVVPNKDCCFDHDREYTQFSHMLSDFENEIGEDDMTHLPEILEKHDVDMDSGIENMEKFAERAKDNINNRCLHHHVFGEENLKKCMKWLGLEVIDLVAWRNDYWVIGKWNKK